MQKPKLTFNHHSSLLKPKNKILKNIFSLTIAEFAGKGLQAFVIFYIAKLLGDVEYGVYDFARQHVAIYILAVTLGMDVLGTREIAENKSCVKKVVNNIMSIRLIFATIAYLLLVVITFSFGDLPPRARTMLLVAGVNIFSMAFMLHWVYQGLERMGVFAIRGLIAAILNIIGILVFVHSPADSLFAMIVVQSSLLINAIWLYLYYSKEFGRIKFSFDKIEWTRILKISFTIGLSFFVVKLYNALDVNMLFYYLGPGNHQSGHLSLAHQYIILGILPAQILQMAFFPQLARNKTKEDRTNIINSFFPIMIVFGLFAGGFIATFPEELTKFYSAEFPNLPPLLMIMSATIMFTYFSILFYTPLMAWGKEKLCLFGNIGGLAANAILNVILIPKYGMYGAAIATISSEIAVMIILAIYFYKTTGSLFIKDIWKWLLVVLCSIIPAFAIKTYLEMPMLSIVTSIILFIVMTFLFKVLSFKELKKLLAR